MKPTRGNRWPCKGGVGAERHALALRLLPVNLRHQQLVPIVGAGHVATPQLRRQAVAVIAEQEQPVIRDFHFGIPRPSTPDGPVAGYSRTNVLGAAVQ